MDLTQFEGVVLAGGRSSRMGRDKALISINGKPLIAQVAGVLASVFESILVVQDRPGHFNDVLASTPNLRLIEDRATFSGPLHGMVRACEESKKPFVFIASCDVPHIRADLIGFLCARMEKQLLAVCPKIADMPQPLLAVYNRERVLESLKMASEQFSSPRALLQRFAPEVLWVDEHTLCAVDTDLASFRNLNEPGDLQL